MIARDMFQERIKNQKPIFVHEFLYPLMQGYDSVAMEVDGEVGGNDQTFNMLVGRELEKEYLNKNKLVFATKLLVNAETGKKMSKTEGGLISVDDEPNDMYGKAMRFIPDEMIATVFELCTEKEPEWIGKRKSDISGGENPKNFKEELAFELVRMFHGEKAAFKAQEEFNRIFSENQLPEDIKELEIKGESISVLDFLGESGLFTSKSEIKRLLSQKAVNVNDQPVSGWDYQVKKGDIVKVGPRKFVKVK
jgi:tyrosyl-tRNA synthetase